MRIHLRCSSSVSTVNAEAQTTETHHQRSAEHLSFGSLFSRAAGMDKVLTKKSKTVTPFPTLNRCRLNVTLPSCLHCLRRRRLSSRAMKLWTLSLIILLQSAYISKLQYTCIPRNPIRKEIGKLKRYWTILLRTLRLLLCEAVRKLYLSLFPQPSLLRHPLPPLQEFCWLQRWGDAAGLRLRHGRA